MCGCVIHITYIGEVSEVLTCEASGWHLCCGRIRCSCCFEYITIVQSVAKQTFHPEEGTKQSNSTYVCVLSKICVWLAVWAHLYSNNQILDAL